MTTLDSLKASDRCCIAAVAGNDPVALRLMEMGLLAGEHVEIIGRAPLGDPMALLVRGSRLALRRHDARRISVVVSAALTANQSSTLPARSH
jgi:ferrous iron transport protein A